AGRTGGPIHEVAVLDSGLLGPALQVVPDLGLVKVAGHHVESISRPDVDVVREPVAKTIARKLGALDVDRAARIAPEDAVLVVEEPAVLHRQVVAFGSNAGSVLIRYLGVMKLHTVDHHVGASHHPRALALRVLAIRKQAGAPAHAANRQVAR